MKLYEILKKVREVKEDGLNVGYYLMKLIEGGYVRNVKKMINDPTNDFGQAYNYALEHAVDCKQEEISIMLMDDYRFTNITSIYYAIKFGAMKGLYKVVKKGLEKEETQISYDCYLGILTAASHKRKRIVKLFMKHEKFNYDDMINNIDKETYKEVMDYLKMCWSEIKRKKRERRINNILK